MMMNMANMAKRWRMPRTRAGAWALLCALLCVSACVSLAACGATPYAAGDATTTSGAAPPGATATPSGPGDAPGAVRLVWTQSRYAATDTLQLTIANGLRAPIYAQTNHADCEVVSLERLVGDTWETAAACGGAFPRPEIVEIAPGGVLAQALAPGAGGGPPGLGGAGGAGGTWPAGTYRATLQYATSQSAPEAQGITLVSASITVG